MITTFKHALLVDNSRVSSFFNQIVLKKTGLIEQVISLDNCQQALDFVNQKKTLNPSPDIIFLSLHTPFMNGWEFLSRYEKLKNKKESHVVVLYSAELLEDEEKKLYEYPFVKAVMNKSIDLNDLYIAYERINQREDLQLIS